MIYWREKKIKNKKTFSVCILCSLLLLSSCNISDTLKMREVDILPTVETEEDNDSVITENADTQTREEATLPDAEEEWVWQNIHKKENMIHVTADELQGNILGYSLLRYSPVPENHMYYERDMSYLVEEEFVGKGVYISDYICETEVFLGNILKKTLADRGTVSGENRQYFTEYALQQLEKTDWETLEGDWEADLWQYDRYYSMHPLSGGGGYQFTYYFYGAKEKTAKEEINQVFMELYVDRDGKICELEITIDTLPMEYNRVEASILMNGLLEDDYGELVIWEGIPCREEMVWDFQCYYRRFMNADEIYEQENKGLLQSGNASSSAVDLADIFLHVMGNRGVGVEKYAKQFGFETDFLDFVHTDWKILEENWTVSKAYDCFFIDRIQDSGYVGFQYYFYPDFQAMGVDEAMMVAIRCNIGCSDGRIAYNTVDIFPITEETCREIRQKQEESRTLVVEKGTALTGKERVAIPVIDRELQNIPISEFDADALATTHSSRKVKEELWGFTDAAEAGAYLGEKFLQDFAENNVEQGEVYKFAGGEPEKGEEEKRIYGGSISDALYQLDEFVREGWKTDGRYDCFCVSSNEVAGCLHLQYYFYPKRDGEGQIKDRIMVVDVFLSEEGIEKMGVNEFCEK